MALLPEPQYRPPFPFSSGHLQTLYPTLFRPVPYADPQPQRLETGDGDFIDIDWHRTDRPGGRLAIVSHGLEGNSRKKYPLGMARHLSSRGWDVICLNFRGCSGEPNRLLRFYHSGVTDDLHTVLMHGIRSGTYFSVALIGFSMGGNQTLKYLGEAPELVPEQVRAAVVFSVPCDLAASSKRLERFENSLYMRYFMQGLKEKVRIKAEMFPGQIDLAGLDGMTTFIPFDDRYTAPIHGFRDAAEYYAKCSAKQYLGGVQVDTLIVQAADDPFLPEECYPIEASRQNDRLHLEIPRHGGHVGFIRTGAENIYWSEQRAADFLDQLIPAER